MEDIENEIQEKVIERQTTQPEVKPKKPRSEAQKSAFEKARAKRAENLKKKQEEEQAIAEDNINPDTLEVKEDKHYSQVVPKNKRGRPRGSTKAKQLEKPRLPVPVSHPVYQPVNHNIPFNQNIPQNFYQYDPRAFQPPPQPQPVNNYYYYGAPPPPQEKELPRRAPTPPQETSSEEEEDYDYDTYGSIQQTYRPPQPKLQFRFV